MDFLLDSSIAMMAEEYLWDFAIQRTQFTSFPVINKVEQRVSWQGQPAIQVNALTLIEDDVGRAIASITAIHCTQL